MNYFDETKYVEFRDGLSKNHFMLTFFIPTSPNYESDKKYIFDICNMISKYLTNVRVSYAIVNETNNQNPIVKVYLPGMPESEIIIYTKSITDSNVCAIIQECRNLALSLRRLNKSQKSPEIARIKEELRQIAVLIKKKRNSKEKLKKLHEDYKTLTEEFMQYVPEHKQKKKMLRLKLDILSENSKEAEQIRNEIEQLKKKNKENRPRKSIELSPHQIERKEENLMIKQLKRVAIKSQNRMYYSYITHALGSIKNFFVKAFNQKNNAKQNEL